jgi:hypothetical protein
LNFIDIKLILDFTKIKMPAYNTGLAKVEVSCSGEIFVVKETLVLRINICGEIRQLRQVAKR